MASLLIISMLNFSNGCRFFVVHFMPCPLLTACFWPNLNIKTVNLIRKMVLMTYHTVGRGADPLPGSGGFFLPRDPDPEGKNPDL